MDNMDIIIRHATAADAELLAKLGARTFQDTFGAYNNPEDMEVYIQKSFGPERQAEELTNPVNVFLIAEIDSVPAGYAMLRTSTPSAGVVGSNVIELARIYVLQDWQGHKLGSRLMQACLDEASRRGHDVLWLGVWEHNPTAIAFYEKWSFERVGAHNFQLGDQIQTDFLYQRPV